MQAAPPLCASHKRVQHVVWQIKLRFASRAYSALYRCSTRRRRNLTTLTLPRHSSRSFTPQQNSTSTSGPSAVLSRIKQFTQERPIWVFSSRSINPYHNLAIENYLLKNSDPSSQILFTYTNRPCVVIGRNQNPWLECDISKVQDGLHGTSSDGPSNDVVHKSSRHRLQEQDINNSASLDLVRRRSGGGTVIHDSGNLNFSFIVPNDKDFTRDKNAQLVVSMLRRYKESGTYMRDAATYGNVRVNERHDIVMTSLTDESATTATKPEFKASGSAFKLTRGRALHHGTLLHSSPNVQDRRSVSSQQQSTFSRLLTSPAKSYLEAKGVGSVRSPVHNLFEVARGEERRKLSTALEVALQKQFLQAHDIEDLAVVQVGDEDCQKDTNEAIYADVREMMTDEWRFCQTPTFDYSSSHSGGKLKLSFQVKHGLIKSAKAETSDDLRSDWTCFTSLNSDMKLHNVQTWEKYVPTTLASFPEVVAHLATVFPKIQLADPETTNSAVNEIANEKAVEGTVRNEQTEQDEIVVTRRLARGTIEIEKEGDNALEEKQSRSSRR